MIADLHAPANPHAVCAGVRIFLQAAANAAPDSDLESSWLHFCTQAADEAHSEVMRRPPLRPTHTESIKGFILRLQNEESGGAVFDAPPPPETIDGTELEAAAHAAAATAFLCCMPPLTSRRRIRAHIACTAVALQRRYLSAGEATKLLYAAQTALMANPKRASRAGKRHK